MDYALQVIDVCERDLALFITPKAREMIAKNREQIGAEKVSPLSRPSPKWILSHLGEGE